MTDNSYRYGLSMRLSGIDPETGQALRPSQKPITIQDTVTAMHAELEQLRSQLSSNEAQRKSLSDCLHYWQARFNVLSDAWRSGNNDGVLSACMAFLKANDGAPANAKLEETNELRSQLSAREAEIANLRSAYEAENRDAAMYRKGFLDTQQKLAAYDACLTQVREEHSEIPAITARAEARRDDFHFAWTVGQNYLNADSDVHKLLGIVEKMLLQEAANRNAIAIHMASIEQLKSDNARLTAANAEYTKRHVEQVARIERLQESANTWHSRAEAHRQASQLLRRAVQWCLNNHARRAFSDFGVPCLMNATEMDEISPPPELAPYILRGRE